MPTELSNGVRLVLDTNTALSGLLWNGTPARLIDAAQDRRIELACSTGLLAIRYWPLLLRRKLI
jgi:predicted nucleic acid-binding protein